MKRRKQRILSLVLALCLVFSMSVSAFASSTSANAMVNADSEGTLQIKVGVTDLQDSSVFHPLQTGTGFLINDTHMVTCFHVVDLDSNAVKYAMETYGMTEKQVKERTTIKVFLYRDDSYTATIAAKSVDADIAILNLKDSIKNRTYLTLRTSDVERSEQCFSLGFPGIMGDYDDQELNTAADVSIDEGIVNKITTVGSIGYVVSSAKTVEGNSGGPLVDANGNVIGVVQAYTSSLAGFADGYSYAITIDEVVNLLNPRGISYTEAGISPTPTESLQPSDAPEPTVTPAPVVDKTALQSQISAASSVSAAVEKCSDTTKSSFDSALNNANTLNTNENATQADVDAAANALASAIDKVKEEASKADANSRMFMIIGIIAAVVVVAAVVLIILLGGKKKKAATPTRPNPLPPTPGPIPVGPSAGKVPPYNPGGMETSLLNQGATETTVLNSGTGETTVLSSNKSLGTLTRLSNHEKISINKSGFTIGKERNAVDYCITGNSSVSRRHAVITEEGGNTYITDNGSTNGTSVNNVRLAPRHKNILNDGDRIQISDEEFIYNSPSMF